MEGPIDAREQRQRAQRRRRIMRRTELGIIEREGSRATDDDVAEVVEYLSGRRIGIPKKL